MKSSRSQGTSNCVEVNLIYKRRTMANWRVWFRIHVSQRAAMKRLAKALDRVEKELAEEQSGLIFCNYYYAADSGDIWCTRERDHDGDHDFKRPPNE